MAAQCTGLPCHIITVCFCHVQGVWAQLRQSVPCMFFSPNLHDTTEEEVTEAALEAFHLWSASYNTEYSKYHGPSLANKLVILAMHEDTDLGLN